MGQAIKNMAKIIIVNEQDEIIGSIEKSEEREGDICRVSALWIENSKGDVLLAQRSFSKSYNPGQWGPAVAGTNEVGETYESNIVKEAEEEIGLRNFKFDKLSKIRSHEGHQYFGQWFKAIVDKDISEFVIDPVEVEKVKWFSQAELKKAIEAEPEIFTKTTVKFTKEKGLAK